MKPFKAFKDLLELYIIDQKSIDLLQRMWNDSHRKYHNEKHLEYVLDNIGKDFLFLGLPRFEQNAIIVAAFFHDAVYDPLKKDNKDESIKFFKKIYRGNRTFCRYVENLIECTKYRRIPHSQMLKVLWNADNHGFKDNFIKFLRIEKLIRAEFSEVPLEEYKEKRIEFLKTNIGLFAPTGDANIKRLIGWIEKNY